MSDRVSNFKLGLFIFVGTTLLVCLVVMFGSGVFSPRGLTVETYIDGSVQGLDVGSPLFYRGIRIGEVSEINLLDSYYPLEDQQFAHFILVRMELDPAQNRLSEPALRERIRRWTDQGLRLRIASQGITGLSYMEAEFVKPEDDRPLEVTWEPDHLYIPSTRTRLARLADSIENIAKGIEAANIPELGNKMDALLASLDTAIADAQIRKVSEGIQLSLKDVQETVAELRDMISDPRFSELATKTSASIDEISETAAELRSSVTEVTDSLVDTIDQTNAAVTDVRQYLADAELRAATSNIAKLTARIEAVVTRVEDSVSNKEERFGAILSDIRAATTNLRDLSDLIAQYPSVAAFGDAPPPSELYQE